MTPAILERVRRQRAAMYAFMREALWASGVDDVLRAAVVHLHDATGADAVVMLEQTNTGTLSVHQQVGLDGEGAAVGSLGIVNEALSGGGVVQSLSAADLETTPPLAERGMQYASAIGGCLDDRRFVLCAFSRRRAFDCDDVLSIDAVMALSIAAISRLRLQNQLTERESTLRALVAQVPATIWTTDRDMILTNILGSDRQTLSCPAADVGVTAEQAGMSRTGLEVTKAALEGEERRYSFTAGERSFDVRVGPLRSNDSSIRGSIGVAFDVTDRDQAEVAARESREELRCLAAAMNAGEEERRRVLARDIHDVMGQRLTALRFELGLLALDTTPDAIRRRIETMAALVEDTADAVRRVAAALRPPLLDDFGLRAALESEVESFQRRTEVRSELVYEGDESKLDSEHVIALYRIVMEALTNIARHAQATRVNVAVRIGNDSVSVEIADNGRGITKEEAGDATALGLIGIRERTYALAGDVEIEGVPAMGTTLRVRLPLQPRPV